MFKVGDNVRFVKRRPYEEKEVFEVLWAGKEIVVLDIDGSEVFPSISWKKDVERSFYTASLELAPKPVVSYLATSPSGDVVFTLEGSANFMDAHGSKYAPYYKVTITEGEAPMIEELSE